MSRSRSVAVMPSSFQNSPSPHSSLSSDHSSNSMPSLNNHHNVSGNLTKSTATVTFINRLYECAFFLRYKQDNINAELEFDYPKGYFYRFNIQQYISKLSLLNTYSNVILYRCNNINIYCKYIPRVGIIGFLAKNQPYYSLFNQLILILYSRILLSSNDNFVIDQLQPFLEYLYYYQPYPKFGEKFLIRYDTKNSILDSSHYLRRPSIDEFIACGEINLLKIKSQLILNDFIILFKYLLLDKFIYKENDQNNNTMNNMNNNNTLNDNNTNNTNNTTTNAANQINPIKIIITTKESSNILEVMNFIYSITSLIYPFKYCGDILPFCDEIKVFEHLINNRHTSSIIGFLQKDYSFEKYLNSTNVIIFDFDSCKILNNLKEFKLISLPKENRVLQMLKNNITKYDTNIRIMDFFVKCMASWFGNYRHHFKLHANLFEFDHSRFITDEHHSSESNDFYKAFSCTHLYKIFIDERTKLVNDYPTFQIQKIQFGRFEQECFKINPRIFTNASTSVSLTNNTNNNNSNGNSSSTTNGTTSGNNNNGNTTLNNTNSTSTSTTSNNNGQSKSNQSNNNSSNSKSTNSGNNGFSLKHLFFKNKTSNSNNQTNQSSINELPEDKHNDKNASDVEPIPSSFGTKVISELQFSKENQLSLSFYCRESDSTKTKFSFSEFHQTIKPPKKYLPEFGEQLVVTKEDVESGDKTPTDLDALLDVNDNSSETHSEDLSHHLEEEESEIIPSRTESFNTVDNEVIISEQNNSLNNSISNIEKVELPPLTSTTTTTTTAITTTTTSIPVTVDEFYD